MAVAALLVLAGCGRGGGDGGGDPAGDATGTLTTEGASTPSGGTSTDGVRYEQRSPRRSFKAHYEGAAALDTPSAIAAFEFEFEETVRRDGETLYRFGAAELAATGGDLRSIPQNASNVSATLLVGEDGVIHGVEYAYDTDTSAVEFSFAVADLGGTTVDEPAWLEAARDGGRLASPTPGDRRAVALRGVA